MKINKIIFAVDDNPAYEGFWEINSEICLKNLGVTPVLFKICDEESDFYQDKFGLIKKIKKIPKIDTNFQAQIYRLYGTKYFMDDICLIHDIDLLIIDKNYINNNIKNLNEDDIAILCSDGYDSKRPECTGIYSGDGFRYPLAYIVGKGRTFSKIIKNDVSFDDYSKKLYSLGYGWDTDEIHFASCLKENNEINVVKIERGYSSNFYCPNRIEKSDFKNNNQLFKINLNGYVNLESFVDCHCPIPFKEYKDVIEKIKNIIISKNKIKTETEKNEEIYLIGCHIENDTQLSLLIKLINFLEKNNKKFILSSHTLIPKEIIEKSVGYIYDSINPKYKSWDLKNYSKFFYETDYFKLFSPYISYGASDYYHIGAIRLIINGIKYIQNLNYNIVHWIEYDCIPDLEMINKSNILLDEYDFIFYGIGSRFSFLKEKVNVEFLNSNDKNLFKLLSENDYVAEKVLSKYLIDGKKYTIYLDENKRELWGEYSQNFNNVKLNWSLFEENNDLNVFLLNISGEDIIIYLEFNDNKNEVYLSPNQWYYQKISDINKTSNFKILFENKVVIDVDLSNEIIYTKLVKSVEFIRK